MYTDIATLKKYMGINFDSTLDSFVEKVITGVSKYINRVCGDDALGVRKFEAPDPDEDEVRYFDGSGSKRLYVGDLWELTSLLVDGVELVEDEDFFLYPQNTETAYHYIELAQPSTRLNATSREFGSEPYIFEVGQHNVEVTGKFYFSDVADETIELATLKLASAVIKENVTDNDVKEIKSETLDDYKVDFQEVSKIAHALKVDNLLSPYVRTSSQGAKMSSRKGGVSVGIIKV